MRDFPGGHDPGFVQTPQGDTFPIHDCHQFPIGADRAMIGLRGNGIDPLLNDLGLADHPESSFSHRR